MPAKLFSSALSIYRIRITVTLYMRSSLSTEILLHCCFIVISFNINMDSQNWYLFVFCHPLIWRPSFGLYGSNRASDILRLCPQENWCCHILFKKLNMCMENSTFLMDSLPLDHYLHAVSKNFRNLNLSKVAIIFKFNKVFINNLSNCSMQVLLSVFIRLQN